MSDKTHEELYQLFCMNGYYPVDKKSNFKNKAKCIDKDGYIVYPSLRNIRENKKPLRFHSSNPDTINNIKHYIETHHINVLLNSDTFIDSKSKLSFQCSCGNTFYTSWGNFYSNKKYVCNECSMGRPSHIVPYHVVIDILNELNLTPLFSENEYSGIASRTSTVQNEYGYKALLTYELVERKKIPEWFHKSNPYTIDNINIYLKNNTNDEYVCVSQEYVGQNDDLVILHKTCGKTFNASWVNLNRKSSEKEPNRHGTRCPYCTGLRDQSLHAVVLKQLFQELKNNTTIEDPSCRNPITNCILPTDIVNHDDKIAIEIQSWFHDNTEQQIKDSIKKNYWESVGYTVYTPDIRDYTVLEMVQIFFPDIDKIPHWVKYDFESKLNVDIAQNLLNSGLLVTEVAKEMGVSPHRIYDAIYNKRLAYPDNYKNRNLIKNKHINQQKTVTTAGCA